MPQILQLEKKDCIVLVWKIEEPIAFFLKELSLKEIDLPSAHEGRNTQWLAARYLLHLLIDSPTIYKDQHQKPYVLNDARYISISHSFDVAAVMLSNKPCGIDIEKDMPRLQRIAPKFIFEDDLIALKLNSAYPEILYRIWCAKEAMYKAYGFGQIDFKKNLNLDIQSILNQNFSFHGTLTKDTTLLFFLLHYEKINHQYHLVYGSII